MISEGYRELNTKLHQTKPSYGVGGYADAKKVKEIAKEYKCKDILDFGCGKAALSKSMGWFAPKVHNYDPAIEAYANLPNSCDLVVCTDVLEHIEPIYLESVLNCLHSSTKKVIYLSIATRPAKKLLADGRNAHLIQEQIEWWIPKLRERFNLVKFWGDEKEFYFIGTPKDLTF